MYTANLSITLTKVHLRFCRVPAVNSINCNSLRDFCMIYVLNSKGEPLMPTARHGRVRHLLRDKKAFIVNYSSFYCSINKGAKYLNSGSCIRD